MFLAVGWPVKKFAFLRFSKSLIAGRKSKMSERELSRGYLLAGAPPDCAGLGRRIGGA
jgi:hypothetical protein